MTAFSPGGSQPGRRTRVAVVLSLLSPSLGMIVLGRGWRALFYLAAFILLPELVLAMAANGHEIAGLTEWTAMGATNLIGILDCWRIARAHPGETPDRWYSKWQVILGVAGTVAVSYGCLRAFVFAPYRLPNEAMLPGLHVNDVLLVRKWQYGIRMPIVHTLLARLGSPERGDMVVFRYPPGSNAYNIKRVVGLPGDQVQIVDHSLFVNGQPVKRTPKQPFYDGARNRQYSQWEENPGSASYAVIYEDSASTSVQPARKVSDSAACTYANDGVSCTVPPDRYFVLGDNRDNSEDSRTWGFVPFGNIVGNVRLVLWNYQDPSRTWTPVQ